MPLEDCGDRLSRATRMHCSTPVAPILKRHGFLCLRRRLPKLMDISMLLMVVGQSRFLSLYFAAVSNISQ
jgi:hypothetical protein